ALKHSHKAAEERAPSSDPSRLDPLPVVRLFSPTNDFISSFQKSVPKRNVVKTTARTKPTARTRYARRKNCTVGVYVVHGSKTATLLERLPKSLHQTLLVVNLGAPSLVANPDKFLNLVNLYFPHPDAGKKIADNIRALARRSPADELAHS